MSKKENEWNRVQLGTDKRSVLGERQQSILIALYRYRFGTRQLLAKSLGVAAGSSYCSMQPWSCSTPLY